MIQIRRYVAGEAEAVWDVVYRATRETNARDYHPDLIERWAPSDMDMSKWSERINSTNPFVAVIDNHIVGMAELISNGYVDYFYVLPEHQGKGVGKALLAIVEAEAERSGLSTLTADVSVTAQPFFSSQGFEITESRSKVVLGHSAPNFAMTKTLKSEQGHAADPSPAP